MDPHHGAKDASSRLKCIKDKLVPIAGTVLVAALLIAVIALAAQKRPSCSPCPTAGPLPPSCPPEWIGVGTQCFYFVEDPADWDGGQRFCLSRGARLAAVESPQELGFVLRYGRSVQYWLGLRRERSGLWMWSNGSRFNNTFSIAGSGHCAHTDGGGIGSDGCSRPKRSVCGRPQWGARGGTEP
ncbi:C-type lectin domain family 2 member D-like [Numida meleagris]|uniref:C-type lectin domain family 2 member D-like n=1 Tax=Numida meleagris TaxID=8996 RepID=UPI000B3E1853|nr:C-type lectin domain family 2 member D-like [Numida meleagris]